jgi:hypothetical protein
MKKLLLISSFILLSSLVFAKKMPKDMSDDDMPTTTSNKLTYDWSQNDKKTDVVLKIANRTGPSTVTVSAIMITVGDEVCMKKTNKEIDIDSGYMVNVGQLFSYKAKSGL